MKPFEVATLRLHFLFCLKCIYTCSWRIKGLFTPIFFCFCVRSVRAAIRRSVLRTFIRTRSDNSRWPKPQSVISSYRAGGWRGEMRGAGEDALSSGVIWSASVPIFASQLNPALAISGADNPAKLAPDRPPESDEFQRFVFRGFVYSLSHRPLLSMMCAARPLTSVPIERARLNTD